MRRVRVIAPFVLLATGYCAGQEAAPPAHSPLDDAQPERVKVYAVGPGVTAPVLLPLALSPLPNENCKKKVDGKVVLSLLVDTAGRPRNIMFLKPLGTDVDRFALQIVGADRFRPGTREGAPVVVGQSLEVGMQACAEQTKDSAGKKTFLVKLRSWPSQKFGALPQTPGDAGLTSSDTNRKEYIGDSDINHVGRGVSAPVPLNDVGAVYTDEARNARVNGDCLLSLIVDRNGMPQDIQVVRGLDYGLQENAVAAVEKYRFKPAMKNGEPVPVKLEVTVSFRIY